MWKNWCDWWHISEYVKHYLLTDGYSIDYEYDLGIWRWDQTSGATVTGADYW